MNSNPLLKFPFSTVMTVRQCREILPIDDITIPKEYEEDKEIVLFILNDQSYPIILDLSDNLKKLIKNKHSSLSYAIVATIGNYIILKICKGNQCTYSLVSKDGKFYKENIQTIEEAISYMETKIRLDLIAQQQTQLEHFREEENQQIVTFKKHKI